MPDLTAANQSLIESNPQDRLRKALHRSFTPNTKEIVEVILQAQRNQIMAEEYEHPSLSREEAIKRATDRLNLALQALKESLIVEIKCERGEWIAIA